jgi:solute carrier family 25 phosphate transporter 23/24/25/41
VAGIIAMSATYPLDMVRGRLTVQADGTASAYTGLGHAVRTIAAKEGLGAFYKGWLPSVIGVVPYVGLNFAVYETLKAQAIAAAGVRDERDLAVATKLAAGAVAGSVGQTVAYPLDVVRRRLQVTGWSASGGAVAAAPAYAGMTDCFVQTVRLEGFGALFKGLWPNYLKVVPSIAIAFVSYEQLKELLGVSFRISD